MLQIGSPLSYFERDQELGIPFFIGRPDPLPIGTILECEGQRFRIVRESSNEEVESIYKAAGRGNIRRCPFSYELITD